MHILRTGLTYFFVLVILEIVYSQKEANIWYFGNKAGLDFNSGNPIELIDGQLITGEGCATISDNNGQLLFYTDGQTVYNRTHAIIPGGTGLKGHSSSAQSAIIIPQPLNDSIFYVFTAPSIGSSTDSGSYYSIINKNLASGSGAIISSKKNIFLTKPVAEKLTAVKHNNGKYIWILYHEYGTAKFLAYLLTDTGLVTSPITSTSGLSYNTATSYAYGLKASPNGTKIASAVAHTSETIVTLELHDFNDSTGIVSNGFTLKNNYLNGYSVEFSPDSRLLYASPYEASILLQYDLSSTSISDIIASEKTIATFNSGFRGAIQLAPNGKIYQSIGVTKYLSVIDSPNLIGNACMFKDSAINLTTGLCLLGLPSFTQSIFFKYIFYADNTCYMDTTYFYLNSYSRIDSIKWIFNDPTGLPGNSSTLLNPYHIFSSPETYNVIAIIYQNQNIDTLTSPIEIIDNHIKLSLSDTLMCNGDTITLSVDSGYLKYIWSNGDSTSTISVDKEGVFWINVYDSTCMNSDTAIISVSNQKLFIGSDTTICFGEDIFININSDYDKYYWSNGESTSAISVNMEGIFWIEVYDSFCNNIQRDSILISNTMCDLYIPNSFSPNGDGVNDELEIQISNIFDIELFIYNRFGKLIFYTNEPNNFWNGKDNENNTVAGLVTYSLIYNRYDMNKIAEIKTYTGNILILK